MKKVIIFSNGYPNVGGRNTFIHELTSGLVDKYTFKIISFRHSFFYSSRLYLISLLLFYSYSFTKIIFTKKKDLFIFGVGPSSLGALFAAKIKKIPTIYNLSDTNKRNFYTLGSKRYNSRFALWFTILFERNCLKHSKIITVPSSYSKGSLLLDYPFISAEKVSVINEGISFTYTSNRNRKKYNYTPTDKIILFPYISERKNISLLLKLIPEFVVNFNMKIILMGSLKEINEENRALLQKYKGNLYFTGKLSKEKKSEIYSLSDLLIYVPKNESHSYTVLEAVHYNLPVLFSNVGWLKEELGEVNQLSVNKFNSNEIMAKIKIYFKENKKIRTKFNGVRKRIENKYSYSNMLLNYGDLFKNGKQTT